MASAGIDLCQIAAAPPPDGFQSNFVNPPSLAPTLLGVLSVLSAWSICFVAARFYINFRKLGVADFFMLIALGEALAILGIFASITKTFRHIWDMPACFFDADFSRGIYIPALLLNTGQFFAKTSIFLLFRQLFQVQRAMRIAIWAGITFCFLIYAVGVAVATYYETPRSGETWVSILGDGRSLIPLPWWQAQSALIIALDFYIFALPLHAIYKLKMPLRKRIQVGAVFSLALLGIGASIASLYERIHITRSIDSTWIATILGICSTVELNVAIIVGSAPAFASFTRATVSQLSSVKSMLSSITSRNTSRMTADTEDGHRGFPEHSERSQKLGSLQSFKSSDSPESQMEKGSIVRTLSVEQQVVHDPVEFPTRREW